MKKWSVTWEELRLAWRQTRVREAIEDAPERYRRAVAIGLSLCKWARGDSMRGEGDCGLCRLSTMENEDIDCDDCYSCKNCPLPSADGGRTCNDDGSLWKRAENVTWEILKVARPFPESRDAAADRLYNALLRCYVAEYNKIRKHEGW